ncbi:MAG: ABC transporter substrate-binding protein, partial [Chloroflexi bacterium]|nr:ABC transporter substrate-binding protein [Chloroflexota bacterium]
MPKKFPVFTLVVFLCTILVGCGSAPASTATLTPETAPIVESTTIPTSVQVEPTPVPAVQDTSYTVVDALGREVTFQQVPQRIVLAGRALFMVADALYLFPDAAQRIAGIGQTNQGSGNFISLIDPEYEAKAVLDKESGAEQIAPLQPDTVILKSSLAETLGSSIEALGLPVVYVDFETPEQYSRDLQILGTLLQDEERAAELASLYQERLDQIENGLAGLDDTSKPRTLLIYATDDEGGVAFNVPPVAWMQTQMV